MPEVAKLTGGLVNYYLSQVDHPQRVEQPPYQAECEDLVESLELTPDEANIFKEIWRSANARKHNGKPGHNALYGAEKIVHYAGRILRRLRRQGHATPSSQVLDAQRSSSPAGAATQCANKARTDITDPRYRETYFHLGEQT